MEHVHRISVQARSLSTARAGLLRVGALALVLITTALVGYKFGWFELEHTAEYIMRLKHSYGVVGFSIGFVLAFGFGSAVGVPGVALTVVAGLLFGTVLGSILSWTGAMLGAAVGYWIARGVGRDVVSRWLRRYSRGNGAIEKSRDFKGMLQLRLIPVLPLGLTNFVGGLARADFWTYMAASAVGIAPATIIYAYFAESLYEGVGKGTIAARLSLVIASVLMIALSLAPKLLERHRRRAHQ